MARKSKPNFTPFNNNKHPKRTILDDLLDPRPKKRINKRTDHHDSRKGGGGNNTGKRR